MSNSEMQSFRHGYADKNIHKVLWLYLPVALIITQFIAANFLNYETYYRIFDTEMGLIENLSVFLAFLALIVGGMIWRLRHNFPSSKYKAYFISIIIGIIYVIGEELSWGQHFFGWDTPEWLGEINQQKETNLHNIHDMFGVVPKIALEWSIYIGGIFMILYFRIKNIKFNYLQDWQFWILPTFIILPSAIMAFIFRIIDRIEVKKDLDFVIDWDETHECLLIFSVFLYMLSIFLRLRETGNNNPG